MDLTGVIDHMASFATRALRFVTRYSVVFLKPTCQAFGKRSITIVSQRLSFMSVVRHRPLEESSLYRLVLTSRQLMSVQDDSPSQTGQHL
jgi:hypothetical protein